jgi:rubrerythrin
MPSSNPTDGSGASSRQSEISYGGNVMDILEFAMEKERHARDFYHQLAEKAPHKGLANIFTMLAGEEEKHYHIVEKMKQSTPQQVTETSVLSDATDVFKKMKQGAVDFDLEQSEIDVYKQARDIETDSRSFYLEKAEQVSDQSRKDVFLQLAEEENKHYYLLDNIIEFVSRPQQWLEDAEWYHLEDY